LSCSKMYKCIQIPGNRSGFVPASLLLLNINKINFACQENGGVFPGVNLRFFFPIPDSSYPVLPEVHPVLFLILLVFLYLLHNWLSPFPLPALPDGFPV